MKNRLFLSGILLVTTFLFLGLRVYDALASSTNQDDSAYSNIAVFTRALQLIRQDYVDEQKVSYHDLTYSALKGMLASLDPHSQFMEPRDYSSMQDDTKSEFGGLGVTVSVRNGTITIVSPMEDTPGFKAGLLPGDQILKINGNLTDKMELGDAIQQLRGAPGESVTLTILRPSAKQVKDYVIQRAIIKVDSIKDAAILSSELTGNFKIGYARVTQFNEPTATELAAKLDKLEAAGMQALILDLRNNPGGLLNSAVDVCSQFLPPNQMVVYTEGRTPSQKKIYRTSEKGKQRTYPVAILINSASASGSEIVAGALKDLNRAVLVGETTFGKGSVQSVIEMPDGSAVRLTTAKYYTPSRQVIHEHGVTPNIRATLTPEQERQLILSRRTDGGPKPTSFRDTQMERAIDALRGLMIYNDGAKQAKAAAPERGS